MPPKAQQAKSQVSSKIKHILVIVLTVALVITSTAASASGGGSRVSLFEDGQAAARERIDGRYSQLLAQLQAALAEIERLRAELTQTQAQLADTQQQVTDRDATIAALKARIAALEAQIPAPVETTPGLWYQRPKVAFNEKRPLLAHIVPWLSGLPRTTWERSYLAPAGESGKHATYGGFARDMPTVYTAREELAALAAYGIDGAFVDLASTAHMTQITALMDNVPPGFLLVPMVDANGSLAGSVSTTATLVNDMLSRPSAWRLGDGRYVVGAFKVEGKTAQWWTDLAAALGRLGKTVLFVGAFNSTGATSSYPSFYATGEWSPGADPAVLQSVPTYVAQVRQRGQVPVVSVLPRGARPREGWYDESWGTGALRTSWNRVIAAGDCVAEIVTANDYAEGAELGPSALTGNAQLALSEWYSYEWLTGKRPAILKPALFLSHRPQLLGATITGGQTQRMTQKARGSGVTASVDEVEVLTLLPAAAEVTVTVGGQTVHYLAPAGEHARYVPAKAGTVSASVAGVQVTSPVQIVASAVSDAPVWVTVWSGDTTKVFDPRPKV